MFTDPIADMLTRIRNASTVGKSEVVIPYSNIKFTIAQILEQEGYLGTVKKAHAGKGAFDEIKIALHNGKIRALKRVSTPSRRMYFGYRDIPKVAGGRGITILSTPRGVMTSKEARKQKVGGEIICEIY